jgi:two-component system NtrC family sensor kinase
MQKKGKLRLTFIIYCFFCTGTLLAEPDTTTINKILRAAIGVLAENNADSSLKLSYTAERLAIAGGDNKSLAQAKYQIGKCYLNKKDYMLAMQNIISADSLYRLINDSTGIASTSLQLGLLEYTQHDYNDAIPYFTATSTLAQQLGNEKLLSTSQYLLGLIYLELYSLDKADSLLNHALYLKKKNANEQGYYECITGLAELEYKRKNYSKSMKLFRQSFSFFSKNQNTSGIAITYLGLGNNFRALNLTDSAFYYANLSYQISEKSNYHDGIIKSTKSLSELYFANHNYEKAYQFLNDYHIIHDSIYNIDNTRKLAKIQYRLNLAQKELKITELNRQRARDKLLLFMMISTTILLVVITIILFRNFRFKQKANRELEQAMKDLQTAQQQLIHREKLASLGQLTAGVAHELKNPLNFIINFSAASNELIGEYISENGQNKDVLIGDLKIILSKIESHGIRANSIITNMMMHARNSEQAKTRTNLTQLLRETVDLAYQGIRASNPSYYCNFIMTIQPEPAFINVIQQQIGRVILNILNNAFYATMKRKETQPDHVPTVNINLRAYGKQIKLSIEDNGTGMSDEVRSRIFEPFFTTKPTGEGTGLGLSISYDMVEANEGLLTVESEQGKFTRFVMTLPVMF